MKTAIIFSGQGSQFLGMGIDFIKNVPNVVEKVTYYSEILDFDILSALQDETKINDTRYTQPLMVVVEMIIHDYLISLGLNVSGYTGFSLGEFSALYAAGFYKEKDILKIINQRAKLMQEASSKYPGTMAAILSLSDEVVVSICDEVSKQNDVVVPANYNSEGQLVISGTKDAVARAVELAKEKGARRAMILNVSGAFHSPYMHEAGLHLKQYVEEFEVHEPTRVVYANTTAKPLDKSDIIDEVYNQISSPVYFKQTINQMVKDGFERFIEVGPGQVLSGLVKKISLKSKVYNVSKFEDIINLEEILK